MSFSEWFRKVSPTILTTIGAAGTIATAVLSAMAVPDAQRRRQEAEEQAEGELTMVDIIKAEAPAYIPAAATGLGTIACIFGANVLNKRQQACLASAYALIERTYGQYKDKVKSLFGEEGDHMVERAVREDQRNIDEGHPPWDEIQTFYFEPYGKFFERTMEQVFQAEYHINRNLVLRGNVTVNEFLDFLGLDPIEHGNEIGWNMWDGECLYGYQWIDFNHRYFETDDGMMVCSIDTPFAPHYEETEFSGEYCMNTIPEMTAK